MAAQFIPDGQLNVDPQFLTFNSNNYSTPQDVMLRGNDDTILEADQHGSVLKFIVRSPREQTATSESGNTTGHKA